MRVRKTIRTARSTFPIVFEKTVPRVAQVIRREGDANRAEDIPRVLTSYSFEVVVKSLRKTCLPTLTALQRRNTSHFTKLGPHCHRERVTRKYVQRGKEYISNCFAKVPWDARVSRMSGHMISFNKYFEHTHTRATRQRSENPEDTRVIRRKIYIK